jgi:hypothetical protein
MFVQTLTIDKLLCTFYVIFIHYAKLILTRKLIYEYLKIKKVLPVAQKKDIYLRILQNSTFLL